ncbi:MAG: argC [Chloroflexi bacterium]|jgi:N-acetyl-gamma-glutamyl-phosphate reductase|nr:argC [Chloroflexota bacterium]
MVDVAIQNITGYAGLSAGLLLSDHPEFKLVAVSGRADAGRMLSDVLPLWSSSRDLRIETAVPAVDLVLCALPHGAAAAAIVPLRTAGSKVVDISADFRLRDASTYATWYGEHPAPEMLASAVYGLPEWRRSEVATAGLVGNPGCYPTASILSIAPVLEAGLIEPFITIDAKSGVSGAGRGLSLGTHFSEVNESVSAYGLSGHRHTPEIEQELSAVAGSPVEIIFTPHLIPMTRGMLVTCYARLTRPVTSQELLELYRERYRNEPFVRILDSSPSTKWTSGTNLCLIHPTVSARGSHMIVLGAIDNLVKGAAGQAIQNANLMFGFPETLGLDRSVVFP